MLLKTNFEMINDVAKVTLEGKLDATTTPLFKEDVEKAIAKNAKKLVLFVKDLDYISSSGLRVLIFFKQKRGTDVDIYFISPKPLIREILEMTGFHYGVIILEEYDPSIENQEKK